MKKLVKSILIIGLGAALFSSCMISRPAKEDTPVRSITVSGSGSVSVKPDMVSIKLVVKTTNWNCLAAAKEMLLIQRIQSMQLKKPEFLNQTFQLMIILSLRIIHILMLVNIQSAILLL